MKINIIDSAPSDDTLPEHLGGHLNKTHVDEGALDFLIENFDIATMLDIGCGPGGMLDLARDRGIHSVGLDGDYTLPRRRNVHLHDFTTGPFLNWENDDIEFDLGWSVEFLEHVESKHVPAIMHAFQRCKYLIVTAAPPGYTGHHHVNCRSLDYWEGAFNASGFYYDADMTAKIKDASSMKKPFLQMNGMFYRRFHYDN